MNEVDGLKKELKILEADVIACKRKLMRLDSMYIRMPISEQVAKRSALMLLESAKCKIEEAEKLVKGYTYKDAEGRFTQDASRPMSSAFGAVCDAIHVMEVEEDIWGNKVQL